MKINGLTIAPPAPTWFVIPHGEQELPFKLQSLASFEEFDKMVPAPVAPKILRPGGVESTDYSDVDYQKAIEERASKRLTWLYLKVLEPSKLEFDKVRVEDPETYQYFDEEFTNIGISKMFVSELKQACIDVCGFNPELIKQATDRFLASMELRNKG